MELGHRKHEGHASKIPGLSEFLYCCIDADLHWNPPGVDGHLYALICEEALCVRLIRVKYDVFVETVLFAEHQ